jgi:hypothetical protein
MTAKTKIAYTKEFLTGTLAGICVRCSFTTTDDALAIHMAALKAVTKATPGSESGGTYWISNIACEEIPAPPPTAKVLRAAIDQAARDAAIASWDVHGQFVPAATAYEFIAGVWTAQEREWAAILPAAMPWTFFSDYARYSRAIQEHNPFIVADLTRPA